MFRIAFSLIVLSLLTGLLAGLQQPHTVADYKKCCRRVSRLIDHGRFKDASLWADRAVHLGASAHLVAGINEEILADDLLALGKYQEAEMVISKLPPVIRLHREYTAVFEVYRRELLGRAYIGQGKFKEALQELRTPVVAESSDRADLNFHAGEALLLLNDKNTAKQMFAQAPRGCYKEEANLYNQILDLADEDNARAKIIADEALFLWQDDHQNGVFELEFCEQIMLQKKCFGAAQIMTNRVLGIKQR